MEPSFHFYESKTRNVMWYEEDFGIKLKSRHLLVFSQLGIHNLSVYNNNVRSTKKESRESGKSAFYTGYVLADTVHYNCIVFISDETMKFLRQDSVFAVYRRNTFITCLFIFREIITIIAITSITIIIIIIIIIRYISYLKAM